MQTLKFDCHRKAELIADIFKENAHELIPSFFHTVIKLHEQKKRFKIVFRTFGTDLERIIPEFNL